MISLLSTSLLGRPDLKKAGVRMGKVAKPWCIYVDCLEPLADGLDALADHYPDNPEIIFGRSILDHIYSRTDQDGMESLYSRCRVDRGVEWLNLNVNCAYGTAVAARLERLKERYTTLRLGVAQRLYDLTPAWAKDKGYRASGPFTSDERTTDGCKKFVKETKAISREFRRTATILRDIVPMIRLKFDAASPLPASNATMAAKSATIGRLLGVFTNGISDDRWQQIAAIVDDESLSSNEKLYGISEVFKIPPTASGANLGELLKVKAQTIMSTKWWIQNRKGQLNELTAKRKATNDEKQTFRDGTGKRVVKSDSKIDDSL